MTNPVADITIKKPGQLLSEIIPAQYFDVLKLRQSLLIIADQY